MMKKNLTRRNFAGLALCGALSAPALLAQGKTIPQSKIDEEMRLLDLHVPTEFKKKIRKALHGTEEKAAALRAYPLQRDTQPALILGVFDAPEMFAREGDRDAG